MRSARLLAASVALAFGCLFSGVGVARSHHSHHNDHDWHDRWENRRDARRAGVVAGVVTAGVARGVAQQRVEQQYQECLYATGYDYDCERQRYWDEQQARRGARRAGVVVGITAREIVRD